MDLYGRPQAPATRRVSTPAVVFLNEHPKAHSFSSRFAPPVPGRSHNGEAREVDVPSSSSSSSSASNQQTLRERKQQFQRRPASDRFLNRPQSGGVRRPTAASAAAEMTKQRPRTARDGMRTLPPGQLLDRACDKRPTCFHEDPRSPASPEADDQGPESDSDVSGGACTSALDERYLRQLKADILHLHRIQLEMEKAAEVSEKASRVSSRDATTRAPNAPNHVKNLLLNRDSKGLSGWGSQRSIDVRTSPRAAPTPASNSVETQLLRYNYSSDSAQLKAAKVGLEAVLTEKLTKLMQSCLAHEVSEQTDEGNDQSSNASAFQPLRAPSELLPPSQQDETSAVPFANGCGTSPASIYTGGLLRVLDRAKIMKRIMLASVGEKKLLAKAAAEKDQRISQLTEQIGFFKDVLAKARPRSERPRVAHGSREEGGRTEGSCSSARSWHSTDSDSASLTLDTERLERLAALEKEQVELQASMHTLQGRNGKLEQQVKQATADLQASQTRLEDIERRHREEMDVTVKKFEKQIELLEEKASVMENHEVELRKSLASASERYRELEEATMQDKLQLRRDKQELERQLQHKAEDARKLQAQAAAKADVQTRAAAAELKRVTQQLTQAQAKTAALQAQATSLQTDNEQRQNIVKDLQKELDHRSDEFAELSIKLKSATSTAESTAVLLQKSEARTAADAKELQQQQVVVERQASQIRQLEAQLSRSIPVDDEELQRRRKKEEGTWHQRIAALEHELVAERQNAALHRDQQRKDVAMEKEKAAHAVQQAQAVADELATANLCLAERKRQREREQQEFERQTTALEARLTALEGDNTTLESELEALRSQHEQAQQRRELDAQEAGDTEARLRQELESAKTEIACLSEKSESLDRALAHALNPPSKSALGTPRKPASLSEARAELQKAKQKIATLEDKLSRNDSSRMRDVDAKLTQLSARERRATEEHRNLKKQRGEAAVERRQLQKERAQLDQQRETQTATAAKQGEEHQLLRKVVEVLAQRLQVLMALFDSVPGQISDWEGSSSVNPRLQQRTLSQDRREDTETLVQFLKTFASENAVEWRELQKRWELLRQELEDVDWKLLHMRNRLEELHLEYVGHPLAPLPSLSASRETVQTSQQRLSSSASASASGFNGANPFSEAVAAGRDTVPVAEQLKSTRSLRRLSCPSNAPESRAAQLNAEEQDTFAIALAKEMTSMKEGYERQLQQLQQELRQTQRLRVETSQRLRAELVAERTRAQQTVAQLTARVAELEAALAAREQALVDAQDQQIALLEQYASAPTETARTEALRALAEVVAALCAEERARRDSQHRDRLQKLHTYCGSSSVSVADRFRVRRDEEEEVAALAPSASAFPPERT